MPLFFVEVKFTLAVEAASWREAESRTATQWAEKELRTHGADGVDATAIPMNDPCEFANCLPWGGDGERTCAEILATKSEG